MRTILNQIDRLWSRFERREQKEKWVRIIYRDGRPLITRYYFFSTRWIDDSEFFKQRPRLQRALLWASFRLVLHHMHESDDDGLHDHPWPWAAWILSRGYFENTPEGLHWRWPGHLRFRSASAFHRLILDPNHRKGVWTLFAMGRRQKEWGFLVDRDQQTEWEPWHVHEGIQRYQLGHAATLDEVSHAE